MLCVCIEPNAVTDLFRADLVVLNISNTLIKAKHVYRNIDTILGHQE